MKRMFRRKPSLYDIGLVVGVLAWVTNRIIGPHLYPNSEQTVSAAIITVAVGAFLVCGTIDSTRRRMRRRARNNAAN